METTTTLTTQRLLLRPWAETDAPRLYTLACDPRIGPSAGWPAHTSVQDSRQIIREVLSAPGTYAVVHRETGMLLGSVGLMVGDQSKLTGGRTDEAEIGYWIGVDYWGQGYIPEACRTLLRHGFLTLGLSTIWCGYYAGNEKSRRAQEKCGFTYHHTLQSVPRPLLGDSSDEVVSRLTRAQWQEQAGET